MDLPLSYSFCKLNNVAITNDNNHSILHVCGELKLDTLSSIQSLFSDTVEKKVYS